MKKFAGLFIAFAAVAFLSTACNKAEEAEVPAETPATETPAPAPAPEPTPAPVDSAAAPATDSTSAQ